MRMTFALLTDSIASERLRARRLSSRRSGGARITRPKIIHPNYHKLLYCYISHGLNALDDLILVVQCGRENGHMTALAHSSRMRILCLNVRSPQA